MEELQRVKAAMKLMYSQEHVDKLEREAQKANLLLIKVQSKWQQAQLSAGRAADGTESGACKTPRPDWDEVQQKLPALQVTKLCYTLRHRL
jgi:hypothetical protein